MQRSRGIYGLLRQSAKLAPAPRRLVVFNPTVAHGFREVYTAMDKADSQDACLIC